MSVTIVEGAAGLAARYPILDGPVLVPRAWIPHVEALLATVDGASIRINLIAQREGALWVTWTGRDGAAESVMEEAAAASAGWPR